MRFVASVGALAASGFLQHAAAQDTGHESSKVGSLANAYDESAKAHQSDATAAPGSPGDSAGGPTCVAHQTTTVFVTVSPTKPASPANDPVDPSKQTAHGTLNLPHTTPVSPVGSAQAADPSVSPFTTITIDLWGTRSGPSGEAATAPAPGSPSSHTSSSPQGSSDGISVGYEEGKAPGSQSTASVDPTNRNGASDNTIVGDATPVTVRLTAAPQGSQFSSGPVSTVAAGSEKGSNPADGEVLWSTVVTDTEVHWTVGPEGPTPVTVFSEHTIFATGPARAVVPITCVTTTGADGRPTVLEWPVASGNDDPALSTVTGLPNGGSVVPQAASTVVSPPSPDITGFTVGVSGSSDEAGSTTCTTYTVLGADGIPTVVHSSWVVPQTGPVTSAPGPLPTGASDASDPQNVPGNAGITTCTSYTFLGQDGRPTVVESTLVLPGTASDKNGLPGDAPTGIPTWITQLPGPIQTGGVALPGGGILTCTTFTRLGTDGLPTIVESTFVVPGQTATPVATLLPGGVVTGVPSQITGFPGAPQPGNAGASGAGGITTCLTYTAIGADGKPTVVESTVVIPASDGVPTGSALGLPSVVPPMQSNLPQGVSQVVPGSPITTCITIDVLGPNGVATPVVQTIVLTPAAAADPTFTTIGNPSVAAQFTDLPQGIPFGSSNGPFTTSITVDVLGPNGVATPVVQTIIIAPTATGLGAPAAPSIVTGTGLPAQPAGPVGQGSGSQGLNAYGAGVSVQQTILPPPAASGFGVQTANGAGASANPFPNGRGSDNSGSLGSPAGAPAQDGYGSNSNGAGSYGSKQRAVAQPAVITLTTLQTRTWTNFIPEQTTTHTMNFPLTTLETITVSAALSPKKRAFRRQESPSWANSTSAAPTVEVASVLTLFPPATSQVLPEASTVPSVMCSGGKVGNTIVNFDDMKLGPLFNPSGDIWFSEGFLVGPLALQPSQSYVPSSGGHLVEFVPPSLANPSGGHVGTGDMAEIGVGPNAASPCFRVDFHSAQLGCAAAGNEKWCEFEVSAYTYNPGLSFEQSIAWSETKRVPACPNFPIGPCALTPVSFEGYKNITSVLITLRVGIELRAWWADDFQFGWTDNSCEAASCRALAGPHAVKRQTIESALRQGVWHWTPMGLQRLDDEYIWDSVN
ncbi:hypothetical protein HIM_07225 [Hirsutella minnesotensis 3608]|uniref:DUF7371 domain-containing protein n=1 Tax=Hirsutella minnesotensis 3608 TaxID=1043627 RepID=A0A0F7ZI52_9HYPO|nr:hypothetical protein HIM_07225 [Hirsutella minnesotensis 3608]